jgi:hypothetical protein
MRTCGWTSFFLIYMSKIYQGGKKEPWFIPGREVLADWITQKTIFTQRASILRRKRGVCFFTVTANASHLWRSCQDISQLYTICLFYSNMCVVHQLKINNNLITLIKQVLHWIWRTIRNSPHAAKCCWTITKQMKREIPDFTEDEAAMVRFYNPTRASRIFPRDLLLQQDGLWARQCFTFDYIKVNVCSISSFPRWPCFHVYIHNIMYFLQLRVVTRVTIKTITGRFNLFYTFSVLSHRVHLHKKKVTS